ncbi:hypothetical protein PG997_011867 [Apiospora hydei]|uniref:Uncharacterized protein n=1 Tax=Apiospora hydei TaxID=1337664 RepID=A0ABR1V4C6_9PEZI
MVSQEGESNPHLNAQLHDARKTQEAAQTDLDKEQDRAFSSFTKARKYGITENQTFHEWAAGRNFPAYLLTRDRLAAAAAKLDNLQHQADGPKAAQLSRDRAAVANGLEPVHSCPGYNMQAGVGNNLQSEGQPIPESPFPRVALYSAPHYRAFVQGAQRQAAVGTYNPDDLVEFTVNPSDDPSKFHFGQTTATGEVGFGYSSWLALNTGGSNSSSSSSTLGITGEDASSVKIKMTFDKLEKIPITLGSW